MLSEEGKRVKQELEDFNQVKKQIAICQGEVTYWKNLGGVLKSPSLEPHLDGGVVEAYAEKQLLKIEALEKKISALIDKALALEDKFLQDIVDLDILSQNLLMERYMSGKPMSKIIREFNYSERHVYRLYDAAFEKLSQKQEDGIKCQ